MDVAERKHPLDVASYAISSSQQGKQINTELTSASLVGPSELTQALYDQQNRNVSCTPEKRKARRDRERERRQSLSLEKREQINARRRERHQNLTHEEREKINARRRARSLENRQRINEQRRERWQRLTPEARQAINARQRARRNSLPPEEQRALLDQRNAIYAAKRDTPCKESIALQCPTVSSVEHPFACSYISSYPGTLTQTLPATQGTLLI